MNKKPVGLYDEGLETQNQDIFAAGDVIDPDYIAISDIAENVITTDEDGLQVLACDVASQLFIDCKGEPIPCGTSIATCADLDEIEVSVTNIINNTYVDNTTVIPSPVEPSQNDFYVSSSGDDSNDGTRAYPFATLDHALSQTNSSSANTIWIEEGTDVYLSKSFSVTNGATRRFIAYGDNIDLYSDWYNSRRDPDDTVSVDPSISADEQSVWNKFSLYATNDFYTRPKLTNRYLYLNSANVDVGNISLSSASTLVIRGLEIYPSAIGDDPAATVSVTNQGMVRGGSDNSLSINFCKVVDDSSSLGTLVSSGILTSGIPAINWTHTQVTSTGDGSIKLIDNSMPIVMSSSNINPGDNPYLAFSDPLSTELAINPSKTDPDEYAYIPADDLVDDDSTSSLIGLVKNPDMITGNTVVQ